MSVTQINVTRNKIGRLVGFVAVFAIFYQVFGGAVRYVLADLGALFVNNVPSVMAAILFVVYFSGALVRRKFEPFMLGIFAWGSIFLLYASFNDLAWMQSVFGFYIWALFLLGTLICVYEQEEFVFKFLPLAWLCTIVGIFINDFVSFPWVGMSYEAHGIQMEMGRKWWATGGIDRLAGFSRANFSAASIIITSLTYILVSHRFGLLKKCTCYFLSCIALYLTTSKTEILILGILPLALVSYEGIKLGAPRSWLYYNWARLCQMTMAALVILLPLILSANSFFNTPNIGFFTSGSLVDRILVTWPDGFRLISEHGNYFFGRGLGGIGAAQLISESGRYTYGDNMFVYILVAGGIFLTVPIFLAFFRSQKELFLKKPEYFEVIFMMSVCVLGVGLMSGVIEDPVVAILLGFLVARGYVTPSFVRQETRATNSIKDTAPKYSL